MDYIREFCPAENKCLVRTNTQGKSAALLLRLLGMAKRDFKGIGDDEFRLIRILNNHKNWSYAWGFTPKGQVPESYTKIDRIPRLIDPKPPIREEG